jgi:hypothetical protein
MIIRRGPLLSAPGATPGSEFPPPLEIGLGTALLLNSAERGPSAAAGNPQPDSLCSLAL